MAVVGLAAFALGTVTSLILAIIVLTFAAGEFFGVLRRAGYHPATLLGLVGTVSLMIAAYEKGPAAVPLVLVLISAFTLLWYLLGIERGSAVAGVRRHPADGGVDLAARHPTPPCCSPRRPTRTGRGSPSCSGPSSPRWPTTSAPWWWAGGSDAIPSPRR